MGLRSVARPASGDPLCWSAKDRSIRFLRHVEKQLKQKESHRGGRPMRVIGIETTCDETGVAFYDGERGLIAHALYSQGARQRGGGGGGPGRAARGRRREALP